MYRRLIRSSFAAALLGQTLTVTAPAAAEDPFAPCEEALALDGGSSGCFFDVAKERNLSEEAAARLERLLEQDPEQVWLRFDLGRIRMNQVRPEAEELLRVAADELLARDELAGAVHSLLNLAKFLGWQGRAAEEPPLLEQAAVVAERSGDPELEALVAVQRAGFVVWQGGDLESIERQLRDLQARIDDYTGYVLHRRILFALADVTYELGRHGEARRLYEELVELAQAEGDGHTEAAARANLAVVALARGSHGEGTEAAIELYRRALAAAVSGGNVYVETDAHVQLGRLIGGGEGLRHLEEAWTRAETLDDPLLLSDVESALAEELARDDPAEARRLIERATRRLAESEDDRAIIYGWTSRATVNWEALPKEEAVADALQLLDHVEALRERQGLRQGRADFFAAWTEVFHWLSGRLLEAFLEGGDEADLRLWLEVSERMRARLLQDALQLADATPALPDSDPLASERNALIDEVVAVNRELLASPPGLAARQPLQAELERLEAELASVEDRIVAEHPRFVARPTPVGLEQLTAALDPRTAVLIYQIAPWRNIYGDFAGGSWLVVLTTRSARAYRLTGRHELEPKLEAFHGLLELPAADERVAAAALYPELLALALAELPSDIKHLVIVPDGSLHLTPFAALRPSPEEAALAERFELSVVPSVTLWASWRSRGSAAASEALVLADPRPAGSTVEVARERGWETLGRLPYARREGRTVLRRLRGDGRLLLGDNASEHLLKQMDLTPYRFLHFAAHAVADAAHPQRSAVVLSPGDPGEDGLLQPREIAGLDLDGRVVVLAACRSAGGRLIRGEGAMSLARPFFQAGASTVVASLWRLDDAAAARLFDAFYRHLADGLTVAKALRAAQAERIGDGALAGDWAGVTVLGDGGAVLGRTVERKTAGSYETAGLLIGALLLLALILYQARESSHCRW